MPLGPGRSTSLSPVSGDFLGIEGKVALVTGGGSGIGAAVARLLAEQGASVAVVDLDLDAATAVADSLPGEALAVGGDVSREEDVEAMVAATAERFGHVDLHHLNAGITGSLNSFEDLSVEDFDRVIDVDLRGVFLGLREAFRQYARQESGGAIVATASISSLRGSSDLIPYHAAKHGAIGLTRCAAIHGAKRGVRVNAIAPGIVFTGIYDNVPNATALRADWERRATKSAQGRPGSVEEIADLVVFLLSERAGFLTGEVVSIDGGAAAINPTRPPAERTAGA